ncbi:MAG: twin-arginine translocase subunit TatC [Anaerolineae bacterium]|nr:twin-arginine translocase subunit TatC [Anaerolineae bacterium]
MRGFFKKLWVIVTLPIRVVLYPFKLIYKWLRNRWLGMLHFFRDEPEDTPLTKTFEKATQSPGDFLKALLLHLAELRWHLIRIALVLVATSIISFAYTEEILEFLAEPLGGLSELRAIDITEPVGVTMRVALLAGFFIAMPYLGLELLTFIAPGIKRKTRVNLLFIIPLVTIFFGLGMAFAYVFMLPVAIPVLTGFSGITTIPRPDTYIRFVVSVMFWIGIAFQFPLVSYLLSAMGILKPDMLVKQWRISIVVLAIIAAAITPTPDPINMMIVFIPLLALYYLGIGLSYLARKRRLSKTNP